MIRLSKMADYGIVLLVQFATQPAATSQSAAELAESTRLPLPTVSKCLKALARAGILESQRGVKGGYRLARPAEAISLADAVQALDGPIALTVCCDEHGESVCGRQCYCTVKVNWLKINSAIEQALASVPLSEMANPHSDVVPSAVEHSLRRNSTRMRCGCDPARPERA